jgi:hypothetical protein
MWKTRSGWSATRSGAALCSLLAVLGVASLAGAQEAAPSDPTADAPAAGSEMPGVEQARAAFTLGTDLAAQGQWTDALAAFERSSRLRSHPVTTYNVAYCERALGHLTRAKKFFAQALADHAAARGGKLSEDLLREAQSYLAETDRRLARAAVTLTPAGAALSVDGRPLEVVERAASRPLLVAGTRDASRPEAAPAGSFELLLDPGHHIFVISTPGAPDTIVEKEFAPGSVTALELTSRDSAATPAPSKPAPERPPGPDHTWTIIAYGVGAAGLVTGTIFGLATLNKSAELDNDCPTKQSCPVSSQDDIDAGERYGRISNIGFIVGAVGVGAGTILLFTTESASTPSRDKASVAFGVGPAGLRVGGRF